MNRPSIYIDPAAISLTDLAMLLRAIALTFPYATLRVEDDALAVSLGEAE